MADSTQDVQEHPIIFSEWSIKRILASEKTQTRRIIKSQPNEEVDAIYNNDGQWFAGTMNSEWDPVLWEEKCPYGHSGDVLWVREAFRFPKFEDDVSPRDLVDYWVGEAGAPPPVKYSTGETKRAWNGHEWGRKRPSIHMPRDLCRIRLRVKGVRVERVQDITPEDAQAEGIRLPQRPPPPEMSAKEIEEADSNILIKRFRQKWNDIHGDGAWEENPWVWIIEFSRIDDE